jgi:predicted phage terminase large subunit-like protein
LLKNTIKKEYRIDSIEPLLAAGQFVFRDSPGCKLLVDQLGEFPRGDHDDGPDALEMAVRGLNEQSAQNAEPVEYSYVQA